MAKAKLLGIKKSKDHNYLIIGDGLNSLGRIRKFLLELGVDTHEAEEFARPSKKDAKGSWETDLRRNEKEKNLIDKHFYFDGINATIDIVFGKKKIFIIMNTKTDLQKKLGEAMKRSFSF